MFASGVPVSTVTYWNGTTFQEAYEILYPTGYVYVSAWNKVTQFWTIFLMQSDNTSKPMILLDKNDSKLDGTPLDKMRGSMDR